MYHAGSRVAIGNVCRSREHGSRCDSCPTAAVIAAQQTRTVSGLVVDSNGESIIGANIVEKGTANGTITDFNGKFSLKVAPNATLVISYIGYKTIEMKASEVKAGQTITLQENAEMMDEVVVIGYGTQRKGDVTSAVASVKAEDFTVGKITDAAELVKGKIAGLASPTLAVTRRLPLPSCCVVSIPCRVTPTRLSW